MRALKQQAQQHQEHAYCAERIARKATDGSPREVAYREAWHLSDLCRTARDEANKAAAAEYAHLSEIRRTLDDALTATQRADDRHGDAFTRAAYSEVCRLIVLVDRAIGAPVREVG